MKKSLLLTFLTLSEPAFGHKGHSHEKQEDKPPAQAQPEVVIENHYTKIRAAYEKDVAPIFKRVCFDCHSSETQYPWYYKLPIVNGLIAKDIAEAREHLDMTDGFPFKGHASVIEDVEAIESDIREGKMPPLEYRIMHWDARLSESDRAKIFKWTKETIRSLKQTGSSNSGT